MFSLISWKEYVLSITILVGLYYLVFVVLYYRKEIREILQKKEEKPVSHGLKSGSLAKPITNETDFSNIFSSVHELIDELNHVFKTAGNNQYTKEQLVRTLQIKISRYPQIRNSAFEKSINNLIERESNNQCSISLREEELKELWKG